MNRKVATLKSEPNEGYLKTQGPYNDLRNQTITIEDHRHLFNQDSYIGHSNRVLHKDTDLLPISHASPSGQIIKRHLAVISTVKNNELEMINRPASRTSLSRKMVRSIPFAPTSSNDPSIHSTKLISTNSWRIGEELAQQQLAQLKPISISKVDTREDSTLKSQAQAKSNSAKSISRTQSHLVQSICNSDRPKVSSVNNPQPIPKSTQKKQRLYEPNEIREFMQRQKVNRLKARKEEKTTQKKRPASQRRVPSVEPVSQSTTATRRKAKASKNLFQENIFEEEASEEDDHSDMSNYFKEKIESLLDQEETAIGTTKKSIKRVEFEHEESSASDNELDFQRIPNHLKRLRKICAVAQDLQNQIDETKQAIERMGDEGIKQPSREKFHKVPDRSPVLSSPTRSKYRELSIQFQEQDVDTIPGVNVFRSDNIKMTRDLAARRIQMAYRQYKSRHGYSTRSGTSKTNNGVKKKLQFPKEFMRKMLNPRVDEYNFINVFIKRKVRAVNDNEPGKKRADKNIQMEISTASKRREVPIETYKSPRQASYVDDFVTFNMASRTERSSIVELFDEAHYQSSIETNLDQSTSSSSSLSKYVNVKNSARKSTTKSETDTIKSLSQSQADSEARYKSTVTTRVQENIPAKQTDSSSVSSSESSESGSKKRSMDLRPRTQRVAAEPSANRYSPASLERLFSINMNYLDTLNISTVQLEELDKIRLVGRAQQETVALAYLLKNEKEKREQIEERKASRSPSPQSTSSSSSTKSSSSSSSTKTINEKESNSRSKNESASSIEIEKIDDDSSQESISEVQTSSELLLEEKPAKKPKEKTESRRISFDENSFQKFNSEMINKYLTEEEMRSQHQAHLLKLRERALVEKTRAELAWLEQMRRKALDKGHDDRMPAMLAKEKDILDKLRRERAHIDRMRTTQRREANTRLDALNQHASVIKQFENEIKRISQLSDEKSREIETASSSVDDDAEGDDSASFPRNNSLVEKKVLKQVKKQLESEKFLTDREKILRMRRKQAEELLAWKKKLDEEEAQVRNIELKAHSALTSKATKSGKNVSISETETTPRPKAFTKANDDEKSYVETFISAPTSSQIHTQIGESEIQRKENKDSESIRTQLEKESSQSIRENIVTATGSSSPSSSPTSSISEMVTATHSSKDLELKVRELKEQLIKKKTQAEQLKQSLKAKETTKLKEKEDELKKKIQSYDALIGQIKEKLDREETSESLSPLETQPLLRPPNLLLKQTFSNEQKPAAKVSTTKPQNRKETVETNVAKSLDEEIKTETITEQIYERSSPSTSSKPTSNKMKIEVAASKKTTKPASPSSSPSPYDDDFVTSEKQGDITGQTKHSSTSSSSSYKENKSAEKKENSNEKTETKRATIIEDDEKSTVSEISEEIMGDFSPAVESKKALRLNLTSFPDQAGSDEESTASSSSSTDTQILLLSSRTKKVGDETVPVDLELQVQSLKNELNQQDAIADKLEKSIIDEFMNEAFELHERKMSKLLAAQYQETIMFGLDEDEREDEDHEDADVNDIGASNPFKIHIPSIDLSLDDEDDLVKLGGKPAPKLPVVFNVPVEKEKISQLTETIIGKYYWARLADLKLIIENSDENRNPPELEEFFSNESSRPEAQEADVAFKRMLFELVGELLYDLYLERFETSQTLSPFLPSMRRAPKKTFFKSTIRGPISVEAATKLIIEKTLELVLKTSGEQKTQTSRNLIVSSRSKWRMQKRLDLVDSLLDREMREQDHEWANYEVEEQEAKIMMANSIFDMILKDTLDCFQISKIKKKQI